MSDLTLRDRRRFLATSLAMISCASSFAEMAHGYSGKAEFPSLNGATGWLNASALTPSGLKGKVVLVEFWTYTCINWLRQLPYIRAWHEKYGSHGLVVIGVHTPEFNFEKNVGNVRWAVRNMNIKFPVAIDSNYEIWRSFRNNSWPALYFIDSQGHIRHSRFGEGEYEKSEKVLQELLGEARASGFDRRLVTVNGRGLEAAADWGSLKSPEIYLGSARTANFSNGPMLGKPLVYSAPRQLRLNQWALSGDWTVKEELSLLNKPSGRVGLRFHARDLHLVMGPAPRAASVRYRVHIDGQSPGDSHGGDIDAQGYGKLVEPRAYQLIRQHRQVEARTFEIEFLDSGAEIYSFTFG